MAHMGFWDGRGDFAYADVVAGRDNVYVDLAYSNVFYEALERLVAIVGPAKVVFGSDFPLHDPGYQVGQVTFSKLPAEEQQIILSTGYSSGYLGLIARYEPKSRIRPRGPRFRTNDVIDDKRNNRLT